MTAEIVGVSLGAAALVGWDVAVSASFAPRISFGLGVLSFIAVAWGLGTLLSAVVAVARKAIGALADRLGSLGRFTAGALDGAALLVVGILATDPQGWSPNFRALVVVGSLVAGGVVRLVVRRVAKGRKRILSIATGVVCAAGATAGLALLQWRREEAMRLAGHLVFAVGCAALGRAALSRRRLSIAVPLGIVAAAGVAITAGSYGFGAFEDARRLLHMQSSHAHAWSFVVERAVDRDRDQVSSLFGGRDCDPSRKDVYPGASEVPGNGRDDNCQRGNRRPDRPIVPSPVRPAIEARPDVFILSVDSLRADASRHLVRTRRALTGVAELTRAVTTCPRTLDALASMARGRPVRSLRLEGVPEVRGSVIWRDTSPTLAHVLVPFGYRAVVIPTTTKVDARSGALAGFETVVAANFDARAHPPPHSPFAYRQLMSADAFPVALEVARATPGPLLLWVHMMDAHAPYFRAHDRAGPETHAAFTQSVRYVDELVSAFLRDLDRVRPKPRIVVVIADHGEEFGEHGSPYHGTSVYAEQVRVVWLVAGPGIPPGRYDGPASIASLPATLLDAIGVPPPPSMSSPTLLPAMRGQAAGPDLAVTELRSGHRTLVGYTGRRYRLVADLAHGWDELFDSARDPHEQSDLSTSRPDALREMRRLASAWEEAN